MPAERINQNDLPLFPVEEALRIARALHDHCAGSSTAPVDVAIAVGIKPTSSNWRYLTGASIGYGLTDGASNAKAISLTELGRRVVAPQAEGDDESALREAVLRPTVIAGFLRKYDGSKFPRDDIAQNVLQHEFGVPARRLDSALEVVVKNALRIGAFREMGRDRYVSLAQRRAMEPQATPTQAEESVDDANLIDGMPLGAPPADPVTDRDEHPARHERPVKTVFVGHSKGTKVLEQVKQLLELGDLKAEVAVDQETSAIPVPDKVFDAMSRSDAAIICVTADSGQEGDDGYQVNPNVLIEIGAAYVRHDKRLVLLWDRRVEVPSNLQGLYRCEFQGDELSWEAGTRLQKALIAIKKGNLPA